MMYNVGPGYIPFEYENLIPGKTNSWNMIGLLTIQSAIRKKEETLKKGLGNLDDSWFRENGQSGIDGEL